MPLSGLKRKRDIHLSQKRTCGEIDRGAGVYGGCYAHEDKTRHHNAYCHLGYRCSDRTPQEPCLKPTTTSQYVYALKLRGKL